jgi:hypothetical protein
LRKLELNVGIFVGFGIRSALIASWGKIQARKCEAGSTKNSGKDNVSNGLDENIENFWNDNEWRSFEEDGEAKVRDVEDCQFKKLRSREWQGQMKKFFEKWIENR